MRLSFFTLQVRPMIAASIRMAMRSALGVMTFGVVGCSGLLDVSNPTLVQDSDIANASGANSRRLDAVVNFSQSYLNAALEVSFFTDEVTHDYYGPPNPPDGDYIANLDRRDNASMLSQAEQTQNDQHLATLDRAFANSSIALTAMRAYGVEPLRGEYLAQLYALRATLILQLAEDMCSGFPLNDISSDNTSVYSGPYSTDSAVAYALAQADSGVAHGRDSARFLNFARIVKGRALLDQGKYAEAAAAVAAVPTTFSYTTDAGQTNRFFYLRNSPLGGVGEQEGQHGMPFVSANDPRVPTEFFQFRQTIPDDSLFAQLKYVNSSDPVVIASGVEARLIEAEAAINAGDPSWFATLNTLRATAITPAMAAIPVMPTTKDAQIDLLYRERAFWLYLTGRRLGDLRRLVRQYGRTPDSVFPSGAYVFGGTYGTATSIPFAQSVQGLFNPNITAGCAAGN